MNRDNSEYSKIPSKRPEQQKEEVYVVDVVLVTVAVASASLDRNHTRSRMSLTVKECSIYQPLKSHIEH